MDTSQPTVAGRFKDHDQDICWVVGVVDLQDRLGYGCQGATALHGERSESHDPRRLEMIKRKKEERLGVRTCFDYNQTDTTETDRLDSDRQTGGSFKQLVFMVKSKVSVTV